jgi:hypothetical protein
MAVPLTLRPPEPVSILAPGPDRAAPGTVEERPPPSTLIAIREVPAAHQPAVTDLPRPPAVLEHIVPRGEAAAPATVEKGPQNRIAVLEPAPPPGRAVLAIQPAPGSPSVPRVQVRIGAIEIHPTGPADTAPSPAPPAVAPTTGQSQAGFDDFVALRTYAPTGW